MLGIFIVTLPTILIEVSKLLIIKDGEDLDLLRDRSLIYLDRVGEDILQQLTTLFGHQLHQTQQNVIENYVYNYVNEGTTIFQSYLLFGAPSKAWYFSVRQKWFQSPRMFIFFFSICQTLLTKACAFVVFLVISIIQCTMYNITISLSADNHYYCHSLIIFTSYFQNLHFWKIIINEIMLINHISLPLMNFSLNLSLDLLGEIWNVDLILAVTIDSMLIIALIS